jgi:hypothetical protein
MVVKVGIAADRLRAVIQRRRAVWEKTMTDKMMPSTKRTWKAVVVPVAVVATEMSGSHITGSVMFSFLVCTTLGVVACGYDKTYK